MVALPGHFRFIAINKLARKGATVDIHMLIIEGFWPDHKSATGLHKACWAQRGFVKFPLTWIYPGIG